MRRRSPWPWLLRRVRRHRVVRRYLAGSSDPRLHLGCGPFLAAGWLNADKFHPGTDIPLDAGERFPLPDGRFSIVYSEHMLEHVPVDDVPNLLREVRRVLRPGGLLRLTVPDLELYARRYVERDTAFFDPILRDLAAKRARRPEKYWLIRSPGGVLMSRAARRIYGHEWMYDFETLQSCLAEVGFSAVVKRRFRESALEAAAAMDREEHAFETLYVDAVK